MASTSQAVLLPLNHISQHDVSNVSDTTPIRRLSNSSSACVHCKSLKVRCQFTRGRIKCDRCEFGGHECAPRSRKKRKVAPTQDDLQLRSRQQDGQIQDLLSQFDQLRVSAKVNEWRQRAVATINVGGSIARPVHPARSHYQLNLTGSSRVDLSPSNPDYQRLPMLLRADILSPFEVEDLFNLFFERINAFFSLLDCEIHSPQRLMWTNHPLFNVICACASRHYTQRPGMYHLLMDIARDTAAKALVFEEKSVEMVQAFLLLSVYPIPQKKWTDNRSWLFMGIAIRLAQELGLDRMPNGLDERENFNRIRTWINCFSVDKAHAAQFGKMHMVSLDDQVIRKTLSTWYKPNPIVNAPYDIGLCAYTEMLLLLAKFRHATGFSDDLHQKYLEGLDVVAYAIDFDKQFSELSQWWSATLHADGNYDLCPAIRYRAYNFTLVSGYMRLIVLSVGFQYAVKKGITRDSYVFQHSIAVAQEAIQAVLDHLFPSGFLSWALEANFLYMAFCAAFLLNLLRPKFLPLLTANQCTSIVALVKALICVLESDDVAIDRRHSPALYAKFLSSMLNTYYTPSLQAALSMGVILEQDILPQYNPATLTMPVGADVFCWPDVTPSHPAPGPVGDANANAFSSMSDNSHVARQLTSEPDMDFSLIHFLDSTLEAPQQAPQTTDLLAIATSHTDSVQAYSLDEVYQLLSCAPSHSDVNWLDSVFENV